jgi:hypothetical protein
MVFYSFVIDHEIPFAYERPLSPGAVVRREHVNFNHGVEGSSPSALTM